VFHSQNMTVARATAERIPSGICRSVLRPCASLQSPEHDLDPVMSFVAAFIVLDGLHFTWDAGLYPSVLQRISEQTSRRHIPGLPVATCLWQLPSRAAAPA
jgi:hypothetical protein